MGSHETSVTAKGGVFIHRKKFDYLFKKEPGTVYISPWNGGHTSLYSVYLTYIVSKQHGETTKTRILY
jgi:hypothetical protein